MKKMKFLSLAVLVLVFGLFGCSTQIEDEDDPTERTYPQAFNFDAVTIEHLKTQVSGPDSLNIEAYLVERFYCPPDVYCFIGNSILISEKANPDPDDLKRGLSLNVTNPLQFKEGQLYVFSIGISEYDNFHLLGYSE